MADEIPRYRYNAELAGSIERSWQDRWEADGTFNSPNPAGPMGEPDKVAGRDKLFILDMFPYPSGTGLHVGHPLGFIGTDVFGRYKRMSGFNVLHAMGFDSFGLPAEQHAIATGIHPRINTEANVTTYKRQLRQLGLAHDNRRSVATTDESFYRWTQWIFLQIFNAWYDPTIAKARPIKELIAEFETGTRATGGGTDWANMDEGAQRKLVDSYRLVYADDMPVNWCPGLGTVLANEEVTADGRSDIGNYPVFRRNMTQWVMRITSYADRLLDDLERLDWPEPIKHMQRNWIGKSHGARVIFRTDAGPLDVFTTRPDTLFGATFMVVAPEHGLVPALTTAAQHDAVEAYVAAAAGRSDMQRQEDKSKTGVFTGSHAVNPMNGELIPVWIADYVLMGYGTGAIMAVPCGDERDFEFARQFELPIRAIQEPPASWFDSHGIDESLDTAGWPRAFIGDARYVNSANDSFTLNGVESIDDAVTSTNAWLEVNGHGHGTINYRLRDWQFARQRYWGEPFPIVWDEHGPIALPDQYLPVLLPDLDDFKPQALDPNDDQSRPLPPLARATNWVEVTLDLGNGPRPYRRELNVMPQWAGSCWYEMRYLDPTNENAFIDPAVEAYWMGPDPSRPGDPGGVDLYVGGVEHAVLHLLYARFWHKVLFDLGHVSSVEPFRRLFNQGYVQAYAYRDDRGQTVPAEEVEALDGGYVWQGQSVAREYGKMGKSLKNVVTPDDMCDAYGADTFRLYEMSTGPLDASRPWNTRDVIGMQRFLQRLWRNLVDETTGELRVVDTEPTYETDRLLHRIVDGVRTDMDNLRFNTAIAKLIELNNHVTGLPSTPRRVAETLVKMTAPLAPHIAEELWHRMGNPYTLTYEAFPEADASFLIDDEVEYPVQINGKIRARITVATGSDQATVEAIAMADDKVVAALAGVEPKKVIVVPGRMVNIVV